MNDGIPQLAGYEVSTLIVGTTQLVKLLVEDGDTELSHRMKIILALIVGLIYLIPTVLINDGYLTAEATAVLCSIVRVVGLLLSVPGWFSVIKDEFLPAFTSQE
jgi:hypothetical protein